VDFEDLEPAGGEHAAQGRTRDPPPPVLVAGPRIEGRVETDPARRRERAAVGPRVEHARAAQARDLRQRLRGEQQRLGGQRAQPLEGEQRVGGVVEQARAPHDVMHAHLLHRRRVVQVAAHEAHRRAAARVLGRVALRGGHHVDRGHRPRARVLGREGERAVDSPHRADVGEGRTGRETGAPAPRAAAGPGVVGRAGAGRARRRSRRGQGRARRDCRS
jgi:hypothetical protein